MGTPEVLQQARRLLGGGWVEPLTLDVSGRICHPDDEGVERLCFVDALMVAAGDDVGAYLQAEAAVMKQLAARGWLLPLYRWLEEPQRTAAEVLQLLAKAQGHAVAGGLR